MSTILVDTRDNFTIITRYLLIIIRFHSGYKHGHHYAKIW